MSFRSNGSSSLSAKSKSFFDYEEQLLKDKNRVTDFIDVADKENSNCSPTVRFRRYADKDLIDCLTIDEQQLRTLYDVLLFVKQKYGKLPMYGTQTYLDDSTRGDYFWISFADFVDACVRLGKAMVSKCRLQKNETVGIYSVNRIEWSLVSWANTTQTLRTVAIYDTFGRESVQYIIEHAELSVIFCEKISVAKLLDIVETQSQNNTPIYLKTIIQFDENKKWNHNKADFVDVADLERAQKFSIQLISLSTFLGDIHNTTLESIKVCPSQPDDLVFVMYTSGTTGLPKGVMLTNRNVVSSAAACSYIMKFYSYDRYMSFLPLAHIYETTAHIVFVVSGARIGFFNGNIRNLSLDLQKLRPTVLCGVPRVFKKIYDNILLKVSNGSFIQKFLFNKALQWSISSIRKQKLDTLSNIVVWSKVRQRAGLDCLRFCLSGAAPLPSYLSEFLKIAFHCSVHQGYGLSETAATVTSSETDDYTSGHCGVPIPCCEYKLVDVPEMDYSHRDAPCPRGEIYVRGNNVFTGYYKSEESTKNAFPDQDGFFATGDIGRLNPNGTLSVIDRRKNIFKLAQGEYISSEKIEGVYSKCSSINQIFVYGNSFKPFLVAVIVPAGDWSATQATKSSLNWPASIDIKLLTKEFAEAFQKLYNDQQSYKMLKKEILAEMKFFDSILKGYEKVRDIVIESDIDDLGQGFSVENECLTPSFKLKRAQLIKRYTTQLKQLYVENGEKILNDEKWTADD